MTDSQSPRPDDETASETVDEAAEAQVRAFWDLARLHAHLSEVPAYFGPTPLYPAPPPPGSCGAGPAPADELLGLVLAGTTPATAGALWDYEAEGEDLPDIGALSIVLDSTGRPRALIETTEVQVVPFDEITDEQARLEGEGDLSLEYWRDAHQRFFTEVADHDRGFSTDMPVVWERFRVLYSD